MKKLRRVKNYNLGATTLPNSIDNSNTIFFPPIGNQGSKGSCVAFAFGYYIQSYLQAKEHNWDLSGASWQGGSTGEPAAIYQNKIFSPDFIYNQINSGIDDGSSPYDAAELIVKIGTATWQDMPYDVSDPTSWPSQAAWENAAKQLVIST